MKSLALLLFLPLFSQAETRGTVDVKGSIGYTGFADEGIVGHLQTGASARIYVTRRFSIEPEFQYLRGSDRHYDLVLIPNVNWDFRPDTRVVPYITGGLGVLHSVDRSPFFNFTHNEGFVQVGAGAKLRMNDRWYVAPEVRVGSELHIRASVAVGYTFRR